MTLNIELKGLLDTIMQHFMKIMSIKPFQPKVNVFLRKEFVKSLDKVEVQLKPAINFITDDQEVELLNNYVFQNLQNHADQIGDQLRQELQRGMLDKENATQLKKRVKDVFADKKYTDRMKTVIRTEKLRANNAGAFSGAKQAEDAGIVLRKYLDVTMDKRTSDICKAEVKKYGTKKEAIPLEDKFIVKVGNKTYKAKYPPFHPNCFLSGTKITTDKGEKNIEDIQIGDNVLTHKNRFKEVYGTMINKANEIFKIETNNGILEVTGEHPIMTRTVMTRNRWKLAKEITKKDWIMYIRCHPKEEFKFFKVKNVSKKECNENVYNFSVKDDETYVANKAIVHNCRTVIRFTREEK